MDSLDRKIIDLIALDSALTSEQLGQRVGLSPSAAHRRVKALEDSGLILGYRARLSPAARGNPSTVFVSVTLVDQRQGTMMTFEEALGRTAQVAEAHLMSGESDYLIRCWFARTTAMSASIGKYCRRCPAFTGSSPSSPSGRLLPISR